MDRKPLHTSKVPLSTANHWSATNKVKWPVWTSKTWTLIRYQALISPSPLESVQILMYSNSPRGRSVVIRKASLAPFLKGTKGLLFLSMFLNRQDLGSWNVLTPVSKSSPLSINWILAVVA